MAPVRSVPSSLAPSRLAPSRIALLIFAPLRSTRPPITALRFASSICAPETTPPSTSPHPLSRIRLTQIHLVAEVHCTAVSKQRIEEQRESVLQRLRSPRARVLPSCRLLPSLVSPISKQASALSPRCAHWRSWPQAPAVLAAKDLRWSGAARSTRAGASAHRQAQGTGSRAAAAAIAKSNRAAFGGRRDAGARPGAPSEGPKNSQPTHFLQRSNLGSVNPRSARPS